MILMQVANIAMHIKKEWFEQVGWVLQFSIDGLGGPHTFLFYTARKLSAS
jgi:hypothetical protein